MKREAIAVVVFLIVAAIGASGLTGEGQPRRSQREPPDQPCRWTAGDAHVRAPATSPSGSTGQAGSVSISELANVASARGLSFLAVISGQPQGAITDPAFGSGGLDWIVGTEREFSPGTVIGYNVPSSLSEPVESLQGLTSFATDTHRSGGSVQLTRVEVGRWSGRHLEAVNPDTVEVWRGGPFSYRTPGLQKDSWKALRFYDRLLDIGMTVAVAGGSGTSQRAFSDLAGPGQPTTWACVVGYGPAAVLSAIRKGRTTISNETPAAKAPLLFLEADQEGDGTFEKQMGDSIPPETMLRVTARGAPAARVRLIASGTTLIGEFVADAFDYSATIAAPEDAKWVRAELYLYEALIPRHQRFCPSLKELRPEIGQPADYCGGLIPMLALSSPIYVE